MSGRARRTPPKKTADDDDAKIASSSTATKRAPRAAASKPKTTIAKKSSPAKSSAKRVAKSVASALAPSPLASSKTPKSPSSSKTPKTIKEAILAIVKSQNKPVGLPTIKKLLISDHDYKQSSQFNTNVNKTIKALVAENRDDFGQLGGGSYICGKSVSKADLERTRREEDEAHEDDYQCPWCKSWNPKDAGELGEDSIARGSKYECPSCGEIYWSWISDGYEYAHEVEYKKSRYYY